MPFGVYFEPVTQTDFGIATKDVVANEFYNSAIGLITFGFIVSSIDPWSKCYDDTDPDLWDPCTDETTVWTPEADETTTWSDCA